MSRKPGKKRQRPQTGQKARAEPLPNWQPISQLFFLGTLIDEQVDVAADQLALLREGRHKPQVLTDAIMARIGTLFLAMQDGSDSFGGGYFHQNFWACGYPPITG